MRKISLFCSALVSAFALFSCSESSQPTVHNYSEVGKKALVIVVENKDIVGQDDLSAFELYRSTVLPIFAELFGVAQTELEDKSLNEILEVYGEDFEIRSMSAAATGKYDTLVVLTDASATTDSLFNRLQLLQQAGYCIDMMWDMHSNGETVSFANERTNVASFTARLHTAGIHIRALYQTCCFGKEMIDSWQSIGIDAVCGAEGSNVLTIFSPAYFIEEWTSGKSFDAAVQAAQQREITTLRSYNNKVPTEAFFLNSTNLQNSKQSMGGSNSNILWEQIPVSML